jgi:hypothetical protein
VALAVAILVAGSRFPRLHASLIVAFLVVAGFLGTVLVALWTLTTHYAAWANANLLVFNPLAFAFIGAAWRSRHGNDGSRRVPTMVGIQVGTAFIGLLIHLLPGKTQQNLPWLLFALPVWLAIAAGLWSKPVSPLWLRFPGDRKNASPQQCGRHKRALAA